LEDSMRWYVSNNGESSGPHAEATVAEWARANELGGAMLRDEAASAWVPLAQTPFAALVPTTARIAAPVAPPKPAASDVSPAAKIGFVVVGSLFVTYYFVTRGDNKPSASAEIPVAVPAAAATPAAMSTPDATTAWVMSKEFVKQQLKSPGSAEFGSPFSGEFQQASEHCKLLDGGAWKCSGWVDAQNEFSAKIRADFTVTVKPDHDGKAWSVIEGPAIVQR
jgi:hypothetical protein